MTFIQFFHRILCAVNGNGMDTNYDGDLLYKRHGNQIAFARLLRKHSTKAESLLWTNLRNRQQSGWKFRRQHPLKAYIVDFYCHELKLVIEIDGEIHCSQAHSLYDNMRTNLLNEIGLEVIRFTNHEVLQHLPKVLDRINNFKIQPLSKI